MRTAFYYKSTGRMGYWTQKNVMSYCTCYSFKQAKAIIKATGIEQTLEIR
jgi:hypothetical protein